MARRQRRQLREVYVFAEGEVTEPEYVDQLKRLQHSFVVRVSSEHGGPDKIVPLAIDHKARMDRDSEAEGRPVGQRPVVWCMFDRDRHPDVDGWIAKAGAAGVRVCFSHPCFEFWMLLHYEDCGAPMAGRCAEPVRRLRAHVPDLGKRFSLHALSGRYRIARARADRIARRHGRDGVVRPAHCDPRTDVWMFVDFLGVDY